MPPPNTSETTPLVSFAGPSSAPCDNPNIYVCLSWDFDGCANGAPTQADSALVMQAQGKSELFEYAKARIRALKDTEMFNAFIDWFKQALSALGVPLDADRINLFSGSLRQTYSSEYFNTLTVKDGKSGRTYCGKGASFPFYEALPELLFRPNGIQISFVPLLMPDIVRWNKTTTPASVELNNAYPSSVGSMFNDTKERSRQFSQYPQVTEQDNKQSAFIDESKILLLFAQTFSFLESCRQKDPSAIAHFYFVDDIHAQPAFEFFKKHPELLPTGLTLHCVEKKTPGLIPTDKGVVQGSASQETFQHWRNILHAVTRDIVGHEFSPGLNADMLAKFFRQTVESRAPVRRRAVPRSEPVFAARERTQQMPEEEKGCCSFWRRKTPSQDSSGLNLSGYGGIAPIL